MKSSNLVAKPHDAALKGFDLSQMEGDISVKLVGEWNPATNHDGQHRVTNFIGQPKAKAFAGNETAPDKPDATEGWPQTSVHELGKIT
jgi:hypothetical protein